MNQVRRMKTMKCPADELSLTNCAIVNPNDFQDNVQHIEVTTGPGKHFVFTIKRYGEITNLNVAFSLLQRKWAELSLGQDIDVKPFFFNLTSTSDCLCNIVLIADFHNPRMATNEPYDTDAMAREFSLQFCKMAFSEGQLLAFKFQEKKILQLTVKCLEAPEPSSGKSGQESRTRRIKMGRLEANTIIQFERSENSSVNLTGKSKGAVVRQSIINPNFDFNKIGIGGLDTEFNAIFRRAFASRVFPPEIAELMGYKHVKGILLYGPPGTGKTLMARQIGKMLNAREPKIVNGPQILDKYVGESEANIRRLFADAEEEEKRAGPNSGLHIIIFDEIDAICKARGSVGGNTGVHDTVVNQLLAKIDGVEQLNNILVIGMTNRRDMIDEALLRPGRLEVQMEISLPNEHGRYQILNIHCSKMYEFKKISPDVDLKELAAATKNFSGAEIEGLVRAAQSTAMNRLIKASSKVEVDPQALEKLVVQREDFLHALENDIKPAFGASADVLEHCAPRGISIWGAPISEILSNGDLLIKEALAAEPSGLVSVLLEGPPNSGKTALAAEIAKRSDFPYIKAFTPATVIGYSENAKVLSLRKLFDDAYKSQLSCILIDNIERLIDYGRIGPRYSNAMVQALLVLLKEMPPKGKKLLVLCTSSERELLKDLSFLPAFTSILHVPNMNLPKQVDHVLKESEVFSKDDLAYIANKLETMKIFVGIKSLLGVIDRVKLVEDANKRGTFLIKLEEISEPY